MKGTPSTFWGKLERDAQRAVVAWHPLEAHCADVAACAEALLTTTIFRRRLANLAGRQDLDDGDIARLSALSALHDIGKFNLGFQRKADAEPRDTAGHVAEVLALFGSAYAVADQLRACLAPARLDSWAASDAAVELLVASIGHHGRPVRCGEVGVDSALWKVQGALDPFAGIGSLLASVRRWFPVAFASPAPSLPDAPPFHHAFAGLVMLADWLGSDRSIFPFAETLDDRMPFARREARKAIRAIGLDVRDARVALGSAVPGFEAVSPFAPREAQQRVLELERPQAGGLTVLESETGSGKTEAALGRFVQMLHAGLVDGMVFALPTRTAATQLHGRVVEAVRRAFHDESSRPPVVLAVPGYLQVDDARGKRLPGFQVLWDDDPRALARRRGWAAEQPKRYLAAAIAVGTIDQVLLSALRVGHAHLRATALLRQFLVVDEVHASDAYMNRILEEVLRFHLAGGGHALLMSATLGTHVRARLERAGLAITAPAPTLADALATPYPAVHHGTRGASPKLVSISGPGLPKRIRVTVEPVADDPVAVATKALGAARQGARVLVLRNTVSDAIATQEALEAAAAEGDAALLFRVGQVTTLHHARFSRDDRVRLDEAIEAHFGKQAPAAGGIIAVATQTVQQSLDLDADIMLTDLAPMDVLLQRFGRVHRHPERNPYRPSELAAPRAIVMTSDGPLDACLRADGEARGRHGAGTVYDDLVILEATRRRLVQRGELVIPEENRELVEVTTHPEALDALAGELGPVWQKHRSRVWGVERAHVGLADLNLIDRKARFGDYSFRTTEIANERIASRLGDSDRRAEFADPRPEGPFGGPVRELTIPGWIARSLPPEPHLTPVVESSAGGVVRFAFGSLPFRYDRLGLRREDAARADISEDIADA